MNTKCIFFSIILGLCSIISADVVEVAKTRIATYMENNDVPGVSAALVLGNTTYLIHMGYANVKKRQKVDEQSLFEIGSIGKNFVATILAYQVLHNNVQLTSTLDTCFPYLQIHPSILNQITVEQLATHTSGLPRNTTLAPSVITKERLLESLHNWQPEYPIGSHYFYSNLGFHILRFALENITGTNYNSLVSSTITFPLGMSNTFHCVPKQLSSHIAQGYNASGEPVSSMNSCTIEATGAYHSTSHDMCRFLQANLGQIGSNTLIEAMKRTRQGFFKVNTFMTQGLSWQLITLNEHVALDKNGATTGFSSWIGLIPEQNIGLVLLTNKASNTLTSFARSLLADLSRS